VFRSRPREEKVLRYYLYISDTKLDMLFEQINPGVLKRISAEVKVDLKLASLTLRGADNPGPTRTAKLQVVERFIEKHHRVGTIAQPGLEYFRGQMDMEWGWIGEDERGVWFQGNDFDDWQYVGLGGSRYNVLGELPQLQMPPMTGLPYIQEALQSSGFLSDPRLTEHELTGDLPSYWHAYIDRPEYRRRTHGNPSQRLEFLAVPLAAPAAIPATRQPAFSPGFTPHGAATLTCPRTRASSPARSARPMTGTSPASDTRSGSSNNACVFNGSCDNRICQVPSRLCRWKHRNSHRPRSEGTFISPRPNTTHSVGGSRLSSADALLPVPGRRDEWTGKIRGSGEGWSGADGTGRACRCRSPARGEPDAVPRSGGALMR